MAHHWSIKIYIDQPLVMYVYWPIIFSSNHYRLMDRQGEVSGFVCSRVKRNGVLWFKENIFFREGGGAFLGEGSQPHSFLILV